MACVFFSPFNNFYLKYGCNYMSKINNKVKDSRECKYIYIYIQRKRKKNI